MKKNVLLFIFTATILCEAGCRQPSKVLIIVGGHRYDTTQFFDMFRSMEGVEFDSVSHPRAIQVLGSELIRDYDLLLFYDFVPDQPLYDTVVFLGLAQTGIPLFFLHHSICNLQAWDGHIRLVGGRYGIPRFEPDSSLHSDYKHDLEMKIDVLDSGHPVTEGITGFMIHDEGYSNIQILEGIHPLLGTSHPDCAPLVGWVNRFRNSTCLYLMLGHDKLAYENDSFQKLLSNSIHWLSGL